MQNKSKIQKIKLEHLVDYFTEGFNSSFDAYDEEEASHDQRRKWQRRIDSDSFPRMLLSVSNVAQKIPLNKTRSIRLKRYVLPLIHFFDVYGLQTPETFEQLCSFNYNSSFYKLAQLQNSFPNFPKYKEHIFLEFSNFIEDFD